MAVVEGAIIYSNLLALLSIGLTITYITTGVPNFAQGSFAIFGSYVSLSLLYFLGLHPYYSLPISLILGGFLGFIIYIGVLKPLIAKEAKIVILMIATLAVGPKPFR
jgi:branched-chain amino acid transport system permease protein